MLERQQKSESWQHGKVKKKHKLQVQRTARNSSPTAAHCETREKETGEKLKKGQGWVQESTERKWERCRFLHCYRAHLACNLQLKPPRLLGTRQAAVQTGVAQDKGKQARNRGISENLAEVIPPKPWSKEGKPDSKMKHKGELDLPSLSWSSRTKKQDNSLSLLLLRSGKPTHVPCPRLGRAKRSGEVHSSSSSASSHLFQALLCPQMLCLLQWTNCTEKDGP